MSKVENPNLSDFTISIVIRSSSADLKMLGIIQSSLEEALYETVQSVKIVKVESNIEINESLGKRLNTMSVKFAPFKEKF